MRAADLPFVPSAGAALRWAAERLAAVPEGSPRLEAERLLTQVSGLSRARCLAWPEQVLAPAVAAAFVALVERRRAGTPIAYLLGAQGFWTLDLLVTPDTLIPRPETERLVELALERLPADQPLRIADLGTGSGAIALALASERPRWRLLATDLSAGALAVARANRDRLGLTARVDLLRARWLAACADRSYDALLGNPPYVAAQDPHLRRGDLRAEPPLALTPGPTGLEAIAAILREAPRCLRPGGLLMLEHGAEQGADVRDAFRRAGLCQVETQSDLANRARVTLGTLGVGQGDVTGPSENPTLSP